MRVLPVLRAAAIAVAFSLRPAFAQQTPLGPAPLAALAPADESFGHFRMSVLGIANAIRLAGDRLAAGADPHAICSGSLAFAGDAIAAWEQAYPQDPAIPRDLLALERTYALAAGAEARAHANATAEWLLRDYPNSEAARELR